jgi:hypothetical protein
VVIEQILATRASIPAKRSALVATTRIDSCGKGYFTAQLLRQLTAQGLRAAIISVDGRLKRAAVSDRRLFETRRGAFQTALLKTAVWRPPLLGMQHGYLGGSGGAASAGAVLSRPRRFRRGVTSGSPPVKLRNNFKASSLPPRDKSVSRK